MQIGYRFNYVKHYCFIWLIFVLCFIIIYYYNHYQLIKGKSTKSFNDQGIKEFSSKTYRYQYWYQQYWPCNYLVSDRHQNFQYRPPVVFADLI